MRYIVAVVPTGTHPYADKFPMLPAAELEELAESIRSNGLRSPVVLTPDGLILDGRNRAAACELAGVTPDTVTYEGQDLAEYVIDCNVTRRNMSTGARAMSTALVLQADGRRRDGRWARGTTMTINENSHLSEGFRVALRNAGVILDFKPDLADAVISGACALDAAYQEAKAIRESADREARIITDLEAAGSKYVASIADGTMAPLDAWQAYLEDTRKEREEAAARRAKDEQARVIT